MKKGKVVIMTAGRFAGKKAIVVDFAEEGNDVTISDFHNTKLSN